MTLAISAIFAALPAGADVRPSARSALFEQAGEAVAPREGAPLAQTWDAKPVVLSVIDALDANGYRIVSVNTTLLNRIRIQAQNEWHLREIVMSQASGQILRDAILEEFKAAPPGTGVLLVPENS